MNSEMRLIDDLALKRLHDLGGSRLVDEMVATFLKNTPVRLGNAAQALVDGNPDGVMRAAHSLKSSCGNVGAVFMREVAEKAEQAALEKRSEALPGLVREMNEAFDAVRPEFEARRVAAVRPCVALVEDNPDNRLLVRAMLEDQYEIREYETGAEALAGLRASRPALVLLDVSLPGMDGTQVLAEIRSDVALRTLPVVALTAHAMSGDRDRFLLAGFDEYVAKPIVEERVLLGAIERLLSSRSSEGRLA